MRRGRVGAILAVPAARLAAVQKSRIRRVSAAAGAEPRGAFVFFRRGVFPGNPRAAFFVPRRVVSFERGEQLGPALLEPLHAELEPVAVALAEAVVVELPHEGREMSI